MKPVEIADTYDQLADLWASPQFPRDNGLAAHRRALAFTRGRGHALDVGCGSSGRIVQTLLDAGLTVDAIDVSPRMVELASARHPGVPFTCADICTWVLPRQYEFITAWDSIWHVPLRDHASVLAKLLNGLSPLGVCLFTMGGLDEPGEKTDAAMGPPAYYSTLGIAGVVDLVTRNQCVLRHFEFDQHPASHLYAIVQRKAVPASSPPTCAP